MSSMSWRFHKAVKVQLGISSLSPASAYSPELHLAMLREVQYAHELYAFALSELKKAHVEFGEILIAPSAKATRAELRAYMSAVVACVEVAATLYDECPDLPFFRVTRTECKIVSERFEVARAHFETTSSEGQLRMETVATYTKALSAFLDSIRELQEITASVIIRRSGN